MKNYRRFNNNNFKLKFLNVGGADGQPAATSSNERGANPNEGEGDEDDDEDVAVDGLLLEEHVKTRGIAGSSFDVEDASQVDVAEEEEGWSAWSGFQYVFIFSNMI